jgi:hypothetical protein
MTFEILDEADEPTTTRRRPIVSGLTAGLICALFTMVVVVPPGSGQGPAATAMPPIEPQPQSGAAPARTASTLTIVSVSQDGVVARLCGDPPVYVRVPPPSGDGPIAIIAPAGRTAGVVDSTASVVPLTTYIYDRTGEHLLYTLADDRHDLIAIGVVPMQDAMIAIDGWRVRIDGRVAIDIQRGSTSPYALCPRALDLLGREGIGHLR